MVIKESDAGAIAVQKVEASCDPAAIPPIRASPGRYITD